MAHLGWNTFSDGLIPNTGQTGDQMWPSLSDPGLNMAWVELIPDDQVRRALDSLRADPTQFGNSFFNLPTRDQINELSQQLLLRLPPLPIQTIGDGEVTLPEVDFRNILLAGWLAWRNTEIAPGAKPLTFFEVNRLCDHAILQNQAIVRQATLIRRRTP
jgi:hypothetical protein